MASVAADHAQVDVPRMCVTMPQKSALIVRRVLAKLRVSVTYPQKTVLPVTRLLQFITLLNIVCVSTVYLRLTAYLMCVIPKSDVSILENSNN